MRGACLPFDPDHCGTGATPPYLAKALSVLKRSTFAASPISLAVRWAHPVNDSSDDPSSFTRSTIRSVRESTLRLIYSRSSTSSRASSANSPDRVLRYLASASRRTRLSSRVGVGCVGSMRWIAS
jgi:hypothetical protein